MQIANSVTDLIGRTPLLRLERYRNKHGLTAEILAKLELFNPGGSAKDRVAKNMLDQAEAQGQLKPGGVIVEPTSGNTGIGLAAVGASRGYRVIITMPDTMSIERRLLMEAYGAEVILTDGKLGMSGAIAKAETLAKEIPNSLLAGQFVNPANPEAHRSSTGPEIWEDTEGQVDVFVAGVGTGGTISGVGAYLKEKNPQIQIIAAEPAGSPVLSGGKAGPHAIQGIGAGFIPQTMNPDICDEIITVPDEAAAATRLELARVEGVLTGISSGAALWAAAQTAKNPKYAGRTIVVLLPDTGERYLSADMK